MAPNTSNSSSHCHTSICIKINHRRRFLIILCLLLLLWMVYIEEKNSGEGRRHIPWDEGNSTSRQNNGSSRPQSPPDKIILFYTQFFGSNWNAMLLGRGNFSSCPVSQCIILQNSSTPEDADAVIFHQADFGYNSVPAVRRQKQLYIWMTFEAPPMKEPVSLPSLKTLMDKKFGWSGFFNWTATYNRHSDILTTYGYLETLQDEVTTSRPGVLDKTGHTYLSYMAALDRGDLPHDLTTYDNRTKMAAWMVSHCSTASGREFYVKELRQYVSVDIYGLCGELKCGKNHKDGYCYSQVLAPNYKFYLAFENNVCQDYLTEKVWRPLEYGLVPVVYGGATFSDFLPHNSYIDATHLTPHQLGQLLIRVASSPQEYGRYHLWRQYWRVGPQLPLCELCRKLHEEVASKVQEDLGSWWRGVNNCTTSYPPDRYPRPPEPDTRTFLEKLMDVWKLFHE